MPITFTFQEFCQVLAALRHWQFHQEGKSLETARMDWDEHFEDCEPMTMEAINALCERINFDDPPPAVSEQPTEQQQAGCIALVRQIANFNKDGEMIQVPDDPEEQYEFQETIEDIEATLHDVIDQARSILNVPAPR